MSVLPLLVATRRVSSSQSTHDESLGLPSQMHTSYPYGNPTRLDHPAALGTYPFGKGDLHLYSQLTYDSSSPLQPRPYTRQGIASASYSTHALHSVWKSGWAWDDLALDELLPVDQRRIEAQRAAKARKGGTGIGGASGGGGGGQAQSQSQSAVPSGGGPPPAPEEPSMDGDTATRMGTSAGAGDAGGMSLELSDDEYL